MIQPFFQYPGCKRRELSIINKYLPKKYNTFVDVFGGSGCVLFSHINDKSIKYHYNDANSVIYSIIDKITDNKKAKKFSKELDKYELTDKNNKKILLDKINVSPEISFLWKGKVAFKGIRSAKIYDNRRKIKGSLINYFNPIEYAKQFEGFQFEKTNLDFKDILNKYKDDKKAFLYLDPPYVGKFLDQYDVGREFTIEDLIFIKDFMDNCKCKVMLNIDYTGYTREEFSDYFKFGYPKTYFVKNGKDRKKVYGDYHLIATNY